MHKSFNVFSFVKSKANISRHTKGSMHSVDVISKQRYTSIYRYWASMKETKSAFDVDARSAPLKESCHKHFWKTMFTAEYYNANKGCTVDFFANRGWKIAGTARDWTLFLRCYVSVRCFWLLSHDNPSFKKTQMGLWWIYVDLLFRSDSRWHVTRI